MKQLVKKWNDLSLIIRILLGLILGTILGVVAPGVTVISVLGIALGTIALLCWKNQTIHVLSDERFTYTTMFGKTKTYAFSDIQGLRRNQDSLTLFVANEKVHIESMAVLSDRLIERINQELKKTN